MSRELNVSRATRSLSTSASKRSAFSCLDSLEASEVGRGVIILVKWSGKSGQIHGKASSFNFFRNNLSHVRFFLRLEFVSVFSSIISLGIKCFSHRKISAASFGFQLSLGTREIHLALLSGSSSYVGKYVTSLIALQLLISSAKRGWVLIRIAFIHPCLPYWMAFYNYFVMSVLKHHHKSCE